MSFTMKTEKDEWTISMGVCSCCGSSTWIGFNKDQNHITADTLDHLFIKIDQYENPEEYE